jgi:hypothetical protein
MLCCFAAAADFSPAAVAVIICACWKRATHGSGAEILPLDPGSPPFHNPLPAMCIGLVPVAMLGGCAVVALVSCAQWSRRVRGGSGWLTGEIEGAPPPPPAPQHNAPDIGLACGRWLGPWREWQNWCCLTLGRPPS